MIGSHTHTRLSSTHTISKLWPWSTPPPSCDCRNFLTHILCPDCAGIPPTHPLIPCLTLSCDCWNPPPPDSMSVLQTHSCNSAGTPPPRFHVCLTFSCNCVGIPPPPPRNKWLHVCLKNTTRLWLLDPPHTRIPSLSLTHSHLCMAVCERDVFNHEVCLFDC